MSKETAIQLFEQKQVRSVWNEEEEKWYFSIVDVMAILTESIDPQAYWRKLKQRLKEEGNETVTDCHALKMVAADGICSLFLTLWLVVSLLMVSLFFIPYYVFQSFHVS